MMATASLFVLAGASLANHLTGRPVSFDFDHFNEGRLELMLFGAAVLFTPFALRRVREAVWAKPRPVREEVK